MAVRERWIYPSDGSPPYQVDTDYKQPRPVAPAVSMHLGTHMRMARQGKVSVGEAQNLVKDNNRERERVKRAEKVRRAHDIADVVKGYGL